MDNLQASLDEQIALMAQLGEQIPLEATLEEQIHLVGSLDEQIFLLASVGASFVEFSGLWVVDKDAVQVVDKNGKKIYVPS